MQTLLTAKQVAEAIDRLYKSVLDRLPSDMPVAVVGVRTRGATLSQRIVDRLGKDLPGREIHHGLLDITFYRDDLSRSRGAPMVRATEIDFDVTGAWLLLVDDVLQTGRSVRAALDAIHDFGRPSVVRLAILIDRGGNELPIAADFVGQSVRVDPRRRVKVQLEENDGAEGVFLKKSAD